MKSLNDVIKTYKKLNFQQLSVAFVRVCLKQTVCSSYIYLPITEVLDKQLRIKISDSSFERRFDDSLSHHYI